MYMGRAVQSRRPEKETRTWHSNCHGKKYQLGGSPNVECLIRVVGAPVRHLNYILMKSRKLKKVLIREEIYAITGDTIDAIILGQLIYWQERVNDFDKFIAEEKERKAEDGIIANMEFRNGWMYKSAKELIDECMLSISEVTMRRHINGLIEKGYVFCRNNPDNKRDKRLQYRVNLDFIIDRIKLVGYDGLSGYTSFDNDSEPKHQNEGSRKQNEDSYIQNEGAISEITNKDYKQKKENMCCISNEIPHIKERNNDKKSSDSSLPLGRDDSTEATEVPKRKVAPKEKGETWRESFDEYMKLVREGAAALKADANFRAEKERLIPNINYEGTIDNCVTSYWGTETGWEKKRRSKTKTINMKLTLMNSFDMNKIYKERQASYSGGSRPRDVDTLHVNDDWAEILAEQERRISDEN